MDCSGRSTAGRRAGPRRTRGPSGPMPDAAAPAACSRPHGSVAGASASHRSPPARSPPPRGRWSTSARDRDRLDLADLYGPGLGHREVTAHMLMLSKSLRRPEPRTGAPRRDSETSIATVLSYRIAERSNTAPGPPRHDEHDPRAVGARRSPTGTHHGRRARHTRNLFAGRRVKGFIGAAERELGAAGAPPQYITQPT